MVVTQGVSAATAAGAEGVPDGQLLQRFVADDSQAAFAALVERHLGLVYGTCLREVRDAQLAEDVTQVVFVLLARKAPALSGTTPLPGWLFRTACFASRNALKQERRHRLREERAARAALDEQTAAWPGSGDSDPWQNVEPHLNNALGALGRVERDAILLRVLEGRSLKETGTLLGLSEDAARMRVTRALEKMRRFLAKQGVAVTTIVLGAVLEQQATHAFPIPAAHSVAQIALSLRITAASAATAGVAGTTYQLMQGVEQAMWITKVKVALIALGVCAAAISLPPLIGRAQTAAGGNTSSQQQSRAGNAATANSSDEQQVLALTRDLYAALTRHDAAFLRRVMTDDFVAVGPDGSFEDKAFSIQEFTVHYGPGSPVHIDATTISDLSFHPYKDTAIVVGRATWKGPGLVNKPTMDIHTFVRQGGQWRLASMQATVVFNSPTSR